MKIKLLILVLALQTAWVLGTVVQEESVRHTGKIVLLETQPVDPRDPLRGDFVRLNYKISNVAREQFSPSPIGEISAGTKIYVTLAPSGTNDFWNVTRASLKSLTPAAGEVLVRGNSQWSWGSSTGAVHIEYGLEKYFVAEGTGNPHGKLTVQVAVAGSGRASIKEVFIDGQPYAEAMKDNAR